MQQYQEIQDKLAKLREEYEADHRPQSRRFVLTRKLALLKSLRDTKGIEETRLKLKQLDSAISGRGLSDTYGGGA